jgi:myo-inositol-1(or 4)-monophosphatase
MGGKPNDPYPRIVLFREETRAAVAAVEQALSLAATGAGSTGVSVKGPRDIVTAADIAIETALRASLGDIPVVGEEGGGVTGEVYWLVDPICGTRNFASGIPLYAVNVALVESGEVTVGVVGDPTTGEVHAAERGGGAWARRDGEWLRLAVSAASETIVIEDSHADPDPARRERAAAAVGAAIRAFRWDLRALSTTLALPYVAAGRAAAYVLFWTSALHVAAGAVLVQEAGAVVSDIDGRPWTLESDSIAASATPELHADLLAL